MKINLLALLALLLSMSVFAGTSVDVKDADGTITPIAGAEGQVTNTLTSCEDEPNSVCRVETQMSPCVDLADKICKASKGFVHSISCWGTDEAATAGRVRLVDDATVTGTAANEIWGAEFAATLQPPVGAILDQIVTRGLHLDFTTTADVKCTVSYR
ncbi:MAG: hypothetical protein ABL879_15370 [Devosia sp.]